MNHAEVFEHAISKKRDSTRRPSKVVHVKMISAREHRVTPLHPICSELGDSDRHSREEAEG